MNDKATTETTAEATPAETQQTVGTEETQKTSTQEPVVETKETQTSDKTEETKPTDSVDTKSAETKTTESDADTKDEQKTTDELDSTESDDRVVPDVKDYVLPDGMPQQVAQFAHDNGMTQKQLDNTLQTFGGFLNQARESEQSSIRAAGEAHVEQWGKQKESNLNLVRRALKQNDPDGALTKVLNETGYGNHPAVLEHFLKIGQSMREGGFLKGSTNSPQKGTTAATAMFGGNHPSKD